MEGLLKWDQTGEKLYETGVDRGVFYPVNQTTGGYDGGDAEVWNGLTAVNESPSGAEATALWADNIKYLNLISAEEFAATIEAYTYPDKFEDFDGTKELVPGVRAGQQDRGIFGFCYRTLIGNDVKATAYGYKLHLVYGCQAAPSEKSRSTVNDSPEAVTFSWELSTTPVNVSPIKGVKFKPTAHLVIDSTKVDADKLGDLEDILYGTDATGTEGEQDYKAATAARLPLPDEVATIIGTNG